ICCSQRVAGLSVQSPSAVRGPHKRPRQHAFETDLGLLHGELVELGRLHPAVYGVQRRVGPQVLGDRHQVGADVAKVPQCLGDLLAGLAHAEDDVRLRDEAGVAGHREDAQRAFVREARADPPEHPGHGLAVVGEHLWPGLQHLVDEVRLAGEVRGEHLDADARVLAMDRTDGLGVQPCALVGQVVAADTGHGRVPQAHRLDALRDALRLLGVVRGGLGRLDLAEVAPARAGVAADEERGLAVLPAFEDVGAAGLLAYRVEAFAAHDRLELGVVGAHDGARTDPGRLALNGGLCVLDLEPEEPAAVRTNCHPNRLPGLGAFHTPRSAAQQGPEHDRPEECGEPRRGDQRGAERELGLASSASGQQDGDRHRDMYEEGAERADEGVREAQPAEERTEEQGQADVTNPELALAEPGDDEVDDRDDDSGDQRDAEAGPRSFDGGRDEKSDDEREHARPHDLVGDLVGGEVGGEEERAHQRCDREGQGFWPRIEAPSGESAEDDTQNGENRGADDAWPYGISEAGPGERGERRRRNADQGTRDSGDGTHDDPIGYLLKLCMMPMTPGPMTTMNSTGRMQSMSGKITLTGICIALASARIRRFNLISAACVLSTLDSARPYASAWMIDRMNCLRSGTWVRSTRSSYATRRVMPTCTSCSVRMSSAARTPVPFFATRTMAASNPRPASTAMLIWSRVSASSSVIFALRSMPMLYKRSSGRKYR